MNTAVSFDSFDAFASADTANMDVIVHGKVTGWIWTFAGPGHEKTIAQGERMAKQRLHDEAQKEQARVNGRKWKARDETPEEKREENINYVIERLIGWSPIQIGGQDFPFTEANARKMLGDRRNPALLGQAFEFLAADDSFTPRSVGS